MNGELFAIASKQRGWSLAGHEDCEGMAVEAEENTSHRSTIVGWAENNVFTQCYVMHREKKDGDRRVQPKRSRVTQLLCCPKTRVVAEQSTEMFRGRPRRGQLLEL